MSLNFFFYHFLYCERLFSRKSRRFGPPYTYIHVRGEGTSRRRRKRARWNVEGISYRNYQGRSKACRCPCISVMKFDALFFAREYKCKIVSDFVTMIRQLFISMVEGDFAGIDQIYGSVYVLERKAKEKEK